MTLSTFATTIVRIRAIEPIPNADAIELAVVGEYRSVVRKGQFQPGDRAIYLPEASVLPDALIEKLGLTGKLAGAAKNRIKAVRLRGCLSQGVLYPEVPVSAGDGEDMSAILGVMKYEPPIPASMGGDVASLFGHPLKYDIENYKAFPDVIHPNELVEMTEKAHGTFCGFGVIPGLSHVEMFDGDGIVYSKGLGAKGLVFKNVPSNDRNIYVQATRSLAIHDRIRSSFPGRVVHVLGEVYGYGVQDLTYGRKDRGFAVFDVNVDGSYLSRDALSDAVAMLGLDRVPIVYRGPFTAAVLSEHTDGETILGGSAHVREGVVVTPMTERRDDQIDRVILKSVSGDYLLRKGDVTEFA
jgi:RNA ligase (TIGR02306 family)